MTEPDETPAPRGTTRRSVLLGAGAVGVAGLLAACGSNPAPTGTNPPAGSGTTAPPATNGGPPATSGAPSASAAPIKTTDIPVGGGTIFKETATVVTQPTAGTFKAFDTTCKHMGCPVTAISSGKIICTCHGSKYNLDGSVAQGPTTAPLDPKMVTVKGDVITVS